MYMILSRTLLTGSKMANVENDPRFGDLIQIGYFSQIFKKEFSRVLSITKSDLGLRGDDIVCSFTISQAGITVSFKGNDKDDCDILVCQNGDLSMAKSLDNERIINQKDCIAILIPDYLPPNIYKGTEALFYVEFEESVTI